MTGRPAQAVGAEEGLLPYARLAVVMLIHSADRERILLVRPRSRPELWSPPGGRLEAGESLEAAAVREAREETGLPVRVLGPCYAYLTLHKGERTLAVSMACRTRSQREAPTLDQEEASSWRWVRPAEWVDLAAAGRSHWTAEDVRRATALARRLIDLEEE